MSQCLKMQLVKSSVNSVVEKHHERILVLSVDHDGEFVYKGNNISFANLAEAADAQNTMRRILSEVLSESETVFFIRTKFIRTASLNLS